MKKYLSAIVFFSMLGATVYAMYKVITEDSPVQPKNHWNFIITQHTHDIMDNNYSYLAKSVTAYKDSVCFIDTAGYRECITGDDIEIQKVGN